MLPPLRQRALLKAFLTNRAEFPPWLCGISLSFQSPEVILLEPKDAELMRLCNSDKRKKSDRKFRHSADVALTLICRGGWGLTRPTNAFPGVGKSVARNCKTIFLVAKSRSRDGSGTCP